MFEVITEFLAFLCLASYYGGCQQRFIGKLLAQSADQVGILAEPFHQNILGAIQCGFAVCDTLFRIDIGLGLMLGVQAWVIEQCICQRFQARFNRNLSLGATLGFVG